MCGRCLTGTRTHEIEARHGDVHEFDSERGEQEQNDFTSVVVHT